MKVALLLVALILSSSCEKSEIKPLFEKKKLSEIHGDGDVMTVRVKLPLSQDTIGRYDASAILEDESLNNNKKENGFFKELFNAIKYRIYDTALVLGISNKVKLSFDYKFPEIPAEVIRSVKVTKLFVALESCQEDDSECVAREEKRPVSLKFLDRFFMNVSAVDQHELASLGSEEDIFIKKDEFEQALKKAFAPAKSFFDVLDSEGRPSPEAFKNVTLATFHNSSSYQEDEEVTRELSKVALLRLRDDLSKGEKVDLIKRLKEPKLAGIIQDMTLIGHNIYLEFKRPVGERDLERIGLHTEDELELAGIQELEVCSVDNCANLRTNQINLIPMLERSSHIRFDTFLNLKSIEKRDFRYNGFVELEVKLDLGI